MANNHQPNHRPHHPLWGNISSPGRVIATVLIVLFVLGMAFPHLAAALLGNGLYALYQGVAPFISVGVIGLVVWLGFSTMFRGARRGGGNQNRH